MVRIMNSTMPETMGSSVFPMPWMAERTMWSRYSTGRKILIMAR